MIGIGFIYFVWLCYLILFSIIAYNKFKMITNHYVITNFFWALSLYISIFHNYYIHPVSDEIYIIFFVGQICFNLTMFTSKILPLDVSLITGEYSLKRRRLIELMVLVVIVPLAYSNLQLILSGEPMWILYEEYWESSATKPYLQELLRQNIILPLATVLMCTCFFTKYVDAKKNSKYLTIFIGFFFSILSFLMSAGGRAGLIQFFYIIVLSWFAGIYLRKDKIVFSIKLSYLIVIAAILFLCIYIATEGRGGDPSLFADILFERLSLYPALFEGYYDCTKECQGFTFGYSMFETPISILAYPFKLIGWEIPIQRISDLEQKPQFCPALSGKTNACVSAYLYYMRDFGYIGIIVGPYIVGMLYNLLWKIFRKDSFLVLFYITGIGLICTSTDYPFTRGYTFVILFVFLYRKVVKVNDKILKNEKVKKLFKHFKYY